MEEQGPHFYSWEESATRQWGLDSGLYALRDDKPDDLAHILWKPGISVQNSAIIELMAHGNPRKAAEVARALVTNYPVTEQSIRAGFGPDLSDYLLLLPLELLPSSPEEYPQPGTDELL
jgi:hypothetical protein